MLSLDDNRWAGLKGGYRVPIDLRPSLRALEADKDPSAAWDQLWQELYHQGDVGEGSFVAVPHLVRIYQSRGLADWNAYALVATIELARGRPGNPDVPAWSREAYEAALRDLAALGLSELPRAKDKESVRSILAVLAIAHGAPLYARILIELEEDEVLELEKQAFGDTSDTKAG